MVKINSKYRDGASLSKPGLKIAECFSSFAVFSFFFYLGKTRLKRQPCMDIKDEYHCFYVAVVDEACETQGVLCSWSCSLC